MNVMNKPEEEISQESLFEQEELDKLPYVSSIDELVYMFQVEAERLKRSPEHIATLLKAGFSANIQNAMIEQGVTKKELAKRLGRSRRHIDRIFPEEISYTLDNMVSICMALGLTLTINVEKKGETE